MLNRKIQTTKDEYIKNATITAIKQKDGHCPCAIEISDDTLCVCKDFRDKVNGDYVGYCQCGLYYVE